MTDDALWKDLNQYGLLVEQTSATYPGIERFRERNSTKPWRYVVQDDPGDTDDGPMTYSTLSAAQERQRELLTRDKGPLLPVEQPPVTPD